LICRGGATRCIRSLRTRTSQREAAEIKMAMTTKAFEFEMFSKKYSVSIDWLINGKGQLESAVAEQS
jgi:hypothetical protein